MSEILISLVIDRLVLFLDGEVNLVRGLRREVDSIKAELQIIQPYLRDADERAERVEETNAGVKALVKQVRQVSYRIEDVVDEYILHLAQHPPPHGFLSFIRKVAHLIIQLKPQHEITSRIQDIKTTICEIQERGDRYGLKVIEEGSNSRTKNETWHDPRVASLFLDDDEVVGIESPRDELISWMAEKAYSKRTLISVVGTGGIGKTTLAKKVYDNQIATGNYDCHAWIIVSQSYKRNELLRTLIMKFYEVIKESTPSEIETMEEVSLIGKLREFLQQRRYVVVFDDVWNPQFWGFIKLALPDNNIGSRAIITTRNNDVASSCIASPFDHIHELKALSKDKAWELFCKKAFLSDYGGFCPPELMELSNNIVKRCDGVPLAIVAIGGLLSTKDKVEFQWQKFHDSLGYELTSNPRLIDITRILSLSYCDLPCYLKPCFLYFGIIPEDYSIRSGRLVRLWIAEGFVKKRGGKTVEEIAQEYLKELIDRSLVQVSWVGFDGKAKSCRVHDLIRETILSRYEELNFCQLLVKEDCCFDGQNRRLSIHTRVATILNSITECRIRSIFTFGKDKLPVSLIGTLVENFKLLKVLDFEDAPINSLPEEVGNLLHLRYLSVKNTKVKTLPKSIGRLYNLLTLDLKNSHVSELPFEINRLHNLRHLLMYYYKTHYSNIQQGVNIQVGFGCLEDMQKLYFVEANHGPGLFKELEKLRQLRKLGIKKVKTEDGKFLCAAVEKMSYLESLDVCSVSEDHILDLRQISTPPKSLQHLHLRGPLEKFPDWISKLQNLVRIRLCLSKFTDDPLKFLQALPILLELVLINAYVGEILYFEEGGFQKLKVLDLRYLDALNSLIIDKGALPLLQTVRIWSCPQLKKMPKEFEKVNLDMFPWP